MGSIRIPKECMELWDGTYRTTTPIGSGYSFRLHRTEEIVLLSDEFLGWAANAIPNSEIMVVYVSGERDVFEVHGSDDDIMLVRMKWYRNKPVPPTEELPDYLYVTAPYSYHAEQTQIPKTFKKV